MSESMDQSVREGQKQKEKKLDKEKIIQEWRKLRARGLSYPEIAKIYGVTKLHVRSWVRTTKFERLTKLGNEK